MYCSIRPWTPEDAPHLACALNNPAVQNNLRDGLPFPYTVKDAQDYIAAMLQADGNTTFARAITLDNQTIGSIGAFRKENIHYRTAEIGYYIAQEHWGKGFGSTALRQMCQMLFETTDLLRIFAEPFARNLASCRILEKAGFTYEGTLRKNAVKNGEILDMKLYALIKE